MRRNAAMVFMVVVLWAAASFAAGLAPGLEAIEGSSLIQGASYNGGERVLRIQLRDSIDVYCYRDVPVEIYEGLLGAKSRGAYYVEHIKAKFPVELEAGE